MSKRPASLAVAALLLVVCTAFCRSQEIDWRCRYDDAVREAYSSGALLMISFVANWDPLLTTPDDPRTKMEDFVWKDTAIVRLSRQFVCVREFCPRRVKGIAEEDRYEQLIKRHRITEFPTTIICDPRGSEFARVVGYTSVEHVKSLLSLAIPKLFSAYRLLPDLDANPDDVGLYVAVGDAYFTSGLSGLSNNYYNGVLDADTVLQDGRLREHIDFHRAVNEYRLNNVRTCVVMFEQLFDTYPSSANRAQYLLWLIKLHVQSAERSRAEEYLYVLEKEYPGSEEARSGQQLLSK